MYVLLRGLVVKPLRRAVFTPLSLWIASMRDACNAEDVDVGDEDDEDEDENEEEDEKQQDGGDDEEEEEEGGDEDCGRSSGEEEEEEEEVEVSSSPSPAVSDVATQTEEGSEDDQQFELVGGDDDDEEEAEEGRNDSGTDGDDESESSDEDKCIKNNKSSFQALPAAPHVSPSSTSPSTFPTPFSATSTSQLQLLHTMETLNEQARSEKERADNKHLCDSSQAIPIFYPTPMRPPQLLPSPAELQRVELPENSDESFNTTYVRPSCEDSDVQCLRRGLDRPDSTPTPRSLEHKGLNTDWNKDFLESERMPDGTIAEKLQKYQRLTSLHTDFLHNAETFGKIIICEHFINQECKTMPPCQLGGTAGGIKYQYHGIIFKLATDWKKIYHGDENALKGAGHELKGVMRYCGNNHVHTPLMALIDYRGFRLVALSVLPIDGTTLLYGSSDGGHTVHNDDPGLATHMEEIARTINIKGHNTGKGEKKILHGPCDIEGHQVGARYTHYPHLLIQYKGKDGQYYVVDFARVFPPTSDVDESSYLYKHFRPEFVKSYKLPLSSDVFSPFSCDSSDVREAKEATEFLFNTTIPNLAQFLSNKRVAHPPQLTEVVHRNGVNLRYLGRILFHTEDQSIRRLIIGEILARIAKRQLRQLLRDKMSSNSERLEEDVFKLLTIDFLNSLLRRDPKILVHSLSFWTPSMMREVEEHFSWACRAPEFGSLEAVLEFVNFWQFFRRVLAITGVSLTKKALEEFKNNLQTEFTVSDIKKIKVMVKHMNILSYDEGCMLYFQAIKTESFDTSRRLFVRACEKFEEGIRATPDNATILSMYAHVLKEFGIKLSQFHAMDISRFERSYEYYKVAKDSEGLLSLAIALKPLISLHSALEHIADAALVDAGQIKPSLNSEIVKARASLKICKARACHDELSYTGAGALLSSLTNGKPTWVTDKAPLHIIASMFEASEHSNNLEIFDSMWIFNRRHFIQQDLVHHLVLHAKLQQLSLARCEVGNGMLKEVMTHCVGLKTLDLTHSKLEPDTILGDALREFHSLSKLVLTKCSPIRENSLCSISFCTRLTHLGLGGATVNIDCFYGICKACPFITKLELRKAKIHTHIPEPELPDAILPDLQHLDAGFCTMPVVLLKKLFTAHSNLTFLSLISVGVVSGDVVGQICANCPRLQHIDLEGCQINAACFIPLSSCTQLEYISLPSLKWNGLQFNKDFSRFIGQCASSLVQFHLKYDPSSGTPTPSQFLSDIAKCRKLTQLTVSNMRVFDDCISSVLSSCTNISSLTLCGSSIQDKTISALAFLSHLLRLDISRCSEVKPDSFVNLARCKTLTALNASKTNLTDEAALRIISSCTGLIKLKLQFCDITDSVISCISRNLHDLRSLDISNCGFVTSVEPLVSGCPFLESLVLYGCLHLTDSSVAAITRLRNLRKLNLAKCQKITDESLQAIKQNMIALKSLVIGNNKFSNDAIITLAKERPDLSLPHREPTPSCEIKPIISENAKKRLLLELKQLNACDYPYVSACPLEHNLFVWHANLVGVEETPYANFIFHIELEFPQDYPASPPNAKLLNPIPHPHVHGGRICMNLLGDYGGYFKRTSGSNGWSNAYTVEQILLQLQTFLFCFEDADTGTFSYNKHSPQLLNKANEFACPICPHKPGSPHPPILTHYEPPWHFTPEEQFRCYHTHASYIEDVLGFGVNVSYYRNGIIEDAMVFPDFLGHHAFSAVQVRSSPLNESFNHWIPIYINALHGAKMKQFVYESVSHVFYNSFSSVPVDVRHVLDVIPAIMNGLVVQICKKTQYPSIKLLHAYCHFHRLFLMFGLENPCLCAQVNAGIEQFINTPAARLKKSTPNLGRFLHLLLISKFSWEDVSLPYLDESFDRQVLNIIKKDPGLEYVGNPHIESKRLEATRIHTATSTKLLLFFVFFLNRIGRPKNSDMTSIASQYDRNFGRPNITDEELCAAVSDIMGVSTWPGFFGRIGIVYPSDAVLTKQLSESVMRSAQKGYHRPCTPQLIMVYPPSPYPYFG
ncbi:Histidine kinase A [Pelomyxa schiedti]|nr:Histidine kinase A [Pelomyxa schiedti]